MLNHIIKNIIVVSCKLVQVTSHINLRISILLIGLFFTFGPSFTSFFPQIDRLTLQLGSYFFESPRVVSKITIVEVPRVKMRQWQSDIHNAGQLSALLANILHGSKTVVGLLLEGPLDDGRGEADQFLQYVSTQKKSGELQEKAAGIYTRKNFLLETLGNQRVVIGINNTNITGLSPWFSESPFFEGVPRWVNSWFWQSCLGCEYDLFQQNLVRPSIEQFPVLPMEYLTNWLYYSQNDGVHYPGFLGKFLAVSMLAQTDESQAASSSPFFASWSSREHFQLGNENVKVSHNGSFFPLNRYFDRMHPEIEVIPLEEALARRVFNTSLFIGAEASEQITQLAQSYYSLTNRRSVATPWWHMPAVRISFLSISLFLFLGIVYLSLFWFSLGSVLTFFTLAGIQLVLLITKGHWLPISNLILFLFLGYFLSCLWREQDQRKTLLLNRVEEASVAQADILVHSDRMDEATRLLLACHTSVAVLQRLYEYAEFYSNDKQYELAINLLREIKQRKKNYRDVEQKISVLSKMLEPEEINIPTDTLEKTTFLDIKRPSDPSVLGRYQVNQEIGRGAVGRVFLGFDPRIARKVAIKTLNYEQFGGNQLEDIKARFFREAEAAGRLNHPNIVSVYDVGEEGSLAYIAMDYVEGKPLNQFVEKDKLLPVFEVYRIISDVAAAIDYAHGNNVVHRDIKPGNIMYSPSPYQVKVTDFGIARLVDDSKTSTGEILGSPLYMAPEQLKGKRVTQEADVFSLGVTFYQLLTGELPFKGDNLASLTYEIIHGKHKNIRSVRKELPASAARIVNQALQKDARDRYESAAEMLTVLKRAMRRDFSTESKNIGII